MGMMANRGVQELVWAGVSINNPTDLHPCKFNDSDGTHICFSQGRQEGMHTHGWGVIMDNGYRIVSIVQPSGGCDMHEFTTSANGRSAIVGTYQRVPYDLFDLGITSGLGWVEQAIFQELDIFSGEVKFEWRSLDHVPPEVETTRTARIPIHGNHPFDYFHLNSVQQNDNGDYLASSRHLNSVFKVSGVDGRVMWRLSNDWSSSYRVENFSLFGQHYARWISVSCATHCRHFEVFHVELTVIKENATHTILSLFNNGANSWHSISNSSALEIVLDHPTRTAYSTKQFWLPVNRTVSTFGSVQVLDDGSILIGARSSLSIRRQDGALALNASLPGSSYRTVLAKWVGHPAEPPDIWAYSLDPTANTRTVIFVSWNGATEVHSWTFHASTAKNGPFQQVATVPKTGFETNCTIAHYIPFVFAEARAMNGSVLGSSTTTKTWSPGSSLAKICDLDQCPNIPLATTQSSVSYPELSTTNHAFITFLIFLAILTLWSRIRRIKFQRAWYLVR